jgi:hypothetical protein
LPGLGGAGVSKNVTKVLFAKKINHLNWACFFKFSLFFTALCEPVAAESKEKE